METETDKKTKAIPELSVETQLAYKRLKKLASGETVTYDELAAAIGRNPQTDGYGNVSTARRMLEREQILVEPVIGVGLKRVDDVACVAVGGRTIEKVRSVTRRGIRKMACANYDALPDQEKTRFNMNASFLGALNQMTRTKSLKALEAKVSEKNQPLPLKNTLALFQ